MSIVELAGTWAAVNTWGDRGTPFYAFSSTGCVQSEEHRADCLMWIDNHCRRAADLNIAAGEFLESHEELDALRAHIAAAPIEPFRV